MPITGSPKPSASSNGTTSPAPRLLRGAGEVVLLALVALSPWPFASNTPPFESALCAGVLLLVALWAAHAAMTGRFTTRLDVVTVCLGGIALWSAAQLVPLPESVVGVLSPTRLEWHRTLNPDVGELLAGEGAAPVRSTFLPLTVDPSATRTFLARVLAVLLVYAAARNWLATPAGFRRLAWVSVATGVAAAVLALSQLFSSPPNVIYWSLRCEGAVFGPFVCRNHYPDLAAVCSGLAIGLLLSDRSKRGRPSAALLSPAGLGLIAAVGLIAASVVFSLSRGGLFAAAVAVAGAGVLGRTGRVGAAHGFVPAVLGAVGLVALGVFGWFGTESIERRMATLGASAAADTRGNLWRDALKLVPRFGATGTGGGTFIWAEPLVRTAHPEVVAEYAHNEYLEAAVEGGAVRLGFTLVLAVGAAVSLGRKFYRRRDRSDAPLLLGAWFGLVAVGLHAAVEFAIHMPALALLVATVGGYAMAVGDRVPEPARPGSRGSGLVAAGAGLVVAGLAVFVALEARSRERVHRLKAAADLVYYDTQTPDRMARRAEYLDARVAYRPDDPVVLFEAAQGRIDAAVEATVAGAGGEAPDRFPPTVVSRHLTPALRFLRAARAANPIAPKPHTRLALLAEYFERSEPGAAHFDRAKKLLPRDATLWFSSGNVALARGEYAAAWADWRRSLALSKQHLTAALTAARRELTPDEILERVLPDEPSVLMAAADQLLPEREGRAAERRPFLQAVATSERPESTAEQLAAVARAHDELGQPDEALRVWRRAVERAPEAVDVRSGYGRWLEQQERYEEAIAEWEWLQQRSPSAAVRDRLDAARHALKLRNGIGSK